MSLKAGYKDPTHPWLSGAELLYQVELSKSWNPGSGYYWASLYRVLRGFNKIEMFFLQCQWSFYRKSEDKLVEGSTEPKRFTSLHACASSLAEIVEDKILLGEKEEIINCIFTNPEYDFSKYDKALKILMVKAPSVKTGFGEAVPKSLSHKFKDSQQERQKKAKW